MPALMKLMFRRIGFHAGSAGKPEVDVVFGGIGFLGPLSFVDRLRELIPFDGFSDPPYVDVAPRRRDRRASTSPCPTCRVGVFSLENISLGADARVPFLGDAMTVGFHFCTKDAPFRLTVMCIGGGGWLGAAGVAQGSGAAGAGARGVRVPVGRPRRGVGLGVDRGRRLPAARGRQGPAHRRTSGSAARSTSSA